MHLLTVSSIFLPSVDGGILATGGEDGTVRIWDLAGAFEVATARSEEECRVAPLETFHTKSTPVVHVRWTRQNLLIAGGAFEA